MEKDKAADIKTPSTVPAQVESFGGRWLVPLIGFIYACGFLVVFTFLKGYGITDLDFIEAKYIHVGSFYLIACIAIILPITWARYLPATKRKFPHVTVPTILAATLMLYVIFGVVLFAPRGFYHDHAFEMILNFALPCMMLFTGISVDLRRSMIGKLRAIFDSTIFDKIIEKLQWVLLLIQIWAAIRTYWALGNFWQMWQREPVCLAFIGLMLLIWLYGWRLINRLLSVQNKSQKFDLIISNGCIIGLLVYLSIWSFARSIYPFIPASKGGGDFSSETPIHIKFKIDATDLIPDDVIKADLANHLILLEQSSAFLFVADNSAANGSTNWQGKLKPPVYEIANDAVVAIIHDNPSP